MAEREQNQARAWPAWKLTLWKLTLWLHQRPKLTLELRLRMASDSEIDICPFTTTFCHTLGCAAPFA